MKMRSQFAVALVTVPDLITARKVARAVLEAHLAACVNFVPKIESHYWWAGKIERGTEVLLLIKSTQPRLASLEKCVLSLHPYDTPEFLVLQVSRGNKRYLDWLLRCLSSSGR